MRQGSNMTVSHKGMRKGISLMEMLVAIILLGIISSVGYSFYKNYYDTSLAAKQVKVSVLIDQANQIKNALELYKVKFGADVNTSQTLTELQVQRILTEVPASIPDMSTTGWTLEELRDINSTLIDQQGGSTLPDQLISYALDGTTTAEADRMDYCNALNNIASNGTTNFDVSSIQLRAGGTGSDINESAVTMNNTFFCNDDDNVSGSTGLTFFFITKIY